MKIITNKKLAFLQEMNDKLVKENARLKNQNEFYVDSLFEWENKNKELFHETIDLRKELTAIKRENEVLENSLKAAEFALEDKDNKIKKFTDRFAKIKKAVLEV